MKPLPTRSRTLLFVSPHFPPDSAAGTHRARILAPHLAKFGWRPVLLTVDPTGIEGDVDRELAASVPGDLDIVRVTPWSSTWTRRVGFGDLGLRAYRALGRSARQAAHSGNVDAVLVTTYPTYPALIGAALKRSAGVPFVLDLQDPWVGSWGKEVGPGGVPDLRSRASRALAVRLERRAASAVDALMSVTTRTMEELVARVPATATRPQLELPIGWEPADWDRVRREARPNGLFDPHDGHFHVCAVGTLLPTARGAVRAFLDGVAQVARTADGRRLKVWFIGTSNERRADAPAAVAPLAARAGVSNIVCEHPPRLAYFDALRVLRDAGAVLVLGSGEPHYTPSRVFPAIASRRPIIARLHPLSPASDLLASVATTRPVHLISCTGQHSEEARAFAEALTKVVACSAPAASNDAPLASFTGEALARRVGALLDTICAR